MAVNPLLESYVHPPFSRIRPEHVEPALDEVLDESRRAIEALLNEATPRTWENFVEPLTEIDERLDRLWAPVRHVNAVANTPALREAYNACLPKLSAYHTELAHNVRLYDAWRSLAESDEYATLDAAQRKVIDDTLRDFRLGGVALAPEAKERFAAIQQALSTLQARFEENLLDATHNWHLSFDEPAALDGLPPSGLDLAAQTAREAGESGYRITLDFPSYYGVMSHCTNRELRQQMYTAYVTRASDRGPDAGRWDNSEAMHDILRLRREAARLLGFANYAEESLATKMAESPQEVFDFLRDLARRTRPTAERELAELREFAAAELGLDELQAWDMAYASERLREHRFDLHQEQLKPYFPVDSVLEGLYGLTERLFGVRIERGPAVDTWHPDVRFYEIRDPDGTLRAQFYLDLYARKHKRGGAWMDECITRRRRAAGAVQHPVAFLTCNSTPPLGEQPALFTHDEVITLFHEFGHGLHHMLTRIDYPDVAGINGVEWDAVELPSQFMENWCWTREALDLFARHYETGATLPDALLDALLASRDFQAGMQMLRQIEFSLFDMRLHQEYEPDAPTDVQALLDEVRAEVAVVTPPPFNRFQHSFTHIFGGGYAAGYYSYKWAEVLSADAFSRFEEDGLFNAETGHAFLHSILERGGSQPAAELFREFRGREPRVDALLRHHGIAA